LLHKFKKNIPQDKYIKTCLVFFTCLNYANEPPEIQEKIRQLCLEIGKEEYCDALFEIMTNKHKSIKRIAIERYFDYSTGTRLRQKFIKKW
jgi:hypothetical protein